VKVYEGALELPFPARNRSVARTLPDTSNEKTGFEVPIPTLPRDVIRRRSEVNAVLKTIAFADETERLNTVSLETVPTFDRLSPAGGGGAAAAYG
jgi:hypothetical protein